MTSFASARLDGFSNRWLVETRPAAILLTKSASRSPPDLIKNNCATRGRRLRVSTRPVSYGEPVSKGCTWSGGGRTKITRVSVLVSEDNKNSARTTVTHAKAAAAAGGAAPVTRPRTPRLARKHNGRAPGLWPPGDAPR